MIVVTGATGRTGRHVVRNLVSAGVPVRAMTRSPERASALPELAGADLVPGDPAQPETLEAAFAGADKMFLLPPPAAHWEQAEAHMVRAARRAGVRHVVKLSIIRLQPDPPSLIFQFHRKAERELEASGMSWTHLRATSFMQNITELWLPLSESDCVFKHCTGSGKLALIDVRDVADAAAVVLSRPGHENRAYELTGPEPLSYAEAAARMSAVLGRQLRCEDMPPAEFEQFLARKGFPAELAAAVTIIYGQAFREGLGAAVSSTFQELTGKAPRTIEDFARETLP